MTGIDLSNVAGNLRYSAQRLHEPKTLDELSTVVAEESQVRAIGTRHACNDLADGPGGLVSLRHLDRVVELDTEGSRVRVDGGITYAELVPTLDAARLALPVLGSIPDVTVAGAVATATHGSGDGNQVLASAVVSLDLVTADGSTRTVHRDDADFAGTVVGLGAFGVVSSLTLDCIPDFDLDTTVYADLPWDVLVDHVDEVHAVGYSVTIIPDWSQDGASSVSVRVPAGEQAMHDLFGAMPVADPLRQPGGGAELQSEYFLPQEAGGELLERLHTLAPELARLTRSTEILTAAADDLWLSPAYERDVVTVRFTWVPDQPAVERVLPAIEELLLPLGARPHWAGLFAASPDELRNAFPELDAVADLITAADPGQKFANDFLRRTGLVPA